MIDRPARDALVQAIEGYLDEHTKAFDFDEAILAVETQDQTVKAVAAELWCYYDDCTDHPIVAAKAEWDFFQRAILLLKSDRCMTMNETRAWSPTQIYAGLGVVTLASAYWIWTPSLFLIVGLAAPLSMLLGVWEHRAIVMPSATQTAIFPFASAGQLRRTCHSVSFKKQRYPRHLAGRRVRGKGLEMFNSVMRYLLWASCAPLVLVGQAMPKSSRRFEVE